MPQSEIGAGAMLLVVNSTYVCSYNVPWEIAARNAVAKGHVQRGIFRRKRKGDRPAVTAQSHPNVVFRRAIQSGSVTLAIGAAAELPQPLGLDHALGLTLLFLAREPQRFPRAAAPLGWLLLR